MVEENIEALDSKVHFVTSFFRSQMIAIIATVLDFVVLVTCVEMMEVYYVVAVAIGTFAGAVVSFYLGRNWAFRKKDGSLTYQAIRYILISGFSLIFNTYGVFLLKDYFGIPYLFSKGIIALAVGIFFNYPMHRYFVFR